MVLSSCLSVCLYLSMYVGAHNIAPMCDDATVLSNHFYFYCLCVGGRRGVIGY